VCPQLYVKIKLDVMMSVMSAYGQNAKQILFSSPVYKTVIRNLPYSMPLSINISPMVRKVRFFFWLLSIVLIYSPPFIH